MRKKALEKNDGNIKGNASEEINGSVGGTCPKKEEAA
jgi:hypothetical protein